MEWGKTERERKERDGLRRRDSTDEREGENYSRLPS